MDGGKPAIAGTNPGRWLLVISLVLVALPSRADVVFDKVALSGEPAPGLGGSVVYGGFPIAPIVNQVGEVAFLAGLGGPGLTGADNAGIFVGRPGQVSLAVREGAFLQGTTSPLRLTLPSLFSPTLAINRHGDLAFDAETAGPDGLRLFDNVLVVVPRGGPVQAVVHDGAAVPGSPAEAFRAFSFAGAFTDDRRVAFQGLTTNFESADTGVWAGTFGDIQAVARESQPIPAIPGTTLGDMLNVNTFPRLNNAGQFALRTDIRGIGINNTNDSALWLGSPEAPNLLLREGLPAAEFPSNVIYFDPRDPVLNDVGRVAFHTQLLEFDPGTGSVTALANAIYTGGLDGLSPVVVGPNPAIGLGPGVNFVSFSAEPILTDAGELAFEASLDGPNVSGFNNSAIYAGPPDAVEPLVRRGDFAAGFIGSVTHGAFTFFDYNSRGQLAYQGLFQGGGFLGVTDKGLWLRDSDGSRTLLVRTGQLFDADPGPAQNLKLVADIVEEFDLSDSGVLAFQLIFDDGSAGLFTARVAGSQSVPGDADGDGDVDAFDLGIWQTQFGSVGPGLAADFDDDGDVDAFDLGLWQANFGTGLTSHVPEPAALVYAAVGGIAITAGRRRPPA